MLWKFLGENLNMNIPAATIFLDAAKVFDKVWHEGLNYKLIQFGIHAGLIHLIYSYLSDCPFCIHINKILSTEYLILLGILQGSVFGPTLFNIFFNDISHRLWTFIDLYADDTAIYFSAHLHTNLYKNLQNHIDFS